VVKQHAMALHAAAQMEAAVAKEHTPTILFLCTGNSCRSQMAEAIARSLHPHAMRFCSAGTHPHGLNPLAMRVLQEIGIDTSQLSSKHMRDVPFQPDVVVTVCDSAHEACPRLPGARTLHKSFDDPPRLAAEAKTDDQALPHYRRVRDEIRAFVQDLPQAISQLKQTSSSTLAFTKEQRS
jgi:arsenate reductase